MESKNIIAGAGEILFENQLVSMSSQRTAYPIIAGSECLLCAVDTEAFLNATGFSFQDLMNRSEILECLRHVPLFRTLPSKKLNAIAGKVKLEIVSCGDKVISEGDEGSKLYILKSGKADVSINKEYIRTLNEYEYFGERTLFFKEPRSATVTAKETLELISVEKEDFNMIFESNFKEHLISRLALQDNQVELNDLMFIKELGRGSSGTVSLVQNKKTKCEYAIKAVSKPQIEFNKLINRIDMEKEILLKIDHPFIVKLVKCMKNEKCFFFLMEHVKGKELWDVIREIGILNNAQTKFYSASILLALDYLHKRKIVYRDIKPENLIVCDTGYLKLIDFGTAKEIDERTFTILGTPHYMAPEVLLGEGYTYTCDFWSSAICMYEFVAGIVPFSEMVDDPMQVYISIINE